MTQQQHNEQCDVTEADLIGMDHCPSCQKEIVFCAYCGEDVVEGMCCPCRFGGDV